MALMVLPLLAILVMRRRTGMVALDAGLIFLCLVLIRVNLRMFLTVIPLVILGLGVLVALTWHEPGGLGQPARAVRTITGDEVSGRDQSSNSYRDLEMRNVWINIKSNNPVTGLGFGREYTFYVPVSDLSFWTLWRYVPHNTFYWMWMKAGIFAFIGMLALFASAIWRSTQILTASHAREVKATAFALAASVIMFTIFVYADLGWVTLPAVTFFAITLGAIGALGYIAPPERAPDTAEAA
jgi:hypothetical protein